MSARVLVLALCLIAAIGAEAAQDCSRPIRAEWLEDGRLMQMLEDYAFVDERGTKWSAPKGWKIDGASIPQFLWTLGGGPYEGKYRKASVVHDVACDLKERGWRDVHRMFYDAMLCSGVDKARAKVMYWAVYECGPRWGGDEAKPRLLPCGDAPKMTAYSVQLLYLLFTGQWSPNAIEGITEILNDPRHPLHAGMSLEELEALDPQWFDGKPKPDPLQLAIDLGAPATDDADFIVTPKREEELANRWRRFSDIITAAGRVLEPATAPAPAEPPARPPQ